MPMFELTPMEAKKEMEHIVSRGRVPMLRSSPGLGKSSIVQQIAKKFNLELIDIRLSQAAPEDLMGLPFRNGEKAEFLPFSMFPLKDDPLPKGKDGWFIFFDEMNSASKSVQAAAYKVILDKMVGMEELHDNVAMACAGNHDSDKAITNKLGTATQSRLVHLNMIHSNEDFQKHWTSVGGMDHRVLGFLAYKKDALHMFDPDHNDLTFPCPRTWEFVSDMIMDVDGSDLSLPILAGCVGEGMAVEFHAFAKEYDKIPSYRAIMENPEGIKMPVETATKWAVISMMGNQMEKDDFSQIVKFVRKFPSELQVLFYRTVSHRVIGIAREKGFREATKHLTKFLHGDDDDI